MQIRCAFSLALVIFFLNNAQSYRILAIFNVPSRSCHISGVTLSEILADRGHNVTIMTPYKLVEETKKFQHIFLSEVSIIVSGNQTNYFDLSSLSFYKSFIYSRRSFSIANATFHDPAFKRLIESNQKFDLIILDWFISDSLIYISEHYQVPLLLYSSIDASSWSNPTLGNPAPPSYISDIYSQYTSDMSFFERLDNSMLYLINAFNRYIFFLKLHNEIVQNVFPGAPHISEYCYKPSIMLLNSDVSVMDPIPKVPGMIDIGGYHIKPPKALPEDLKNILDNAGHGVIYFSIGSNVKSKQMPKEKLQILIEVFSTLNETILWKWEDGSIPGISSNVVTRKWLPQNDILAHKNVKLFITHAGFHSILETIYHGVPCVALPIFLDQVKNAQKAASLGYAEWLKMSDLTVHNLKTALEKVLKNSSYTTVARQRSRIMRDKPISPVDTIEFWVNYIVRHKGAPHLKVASWKLTWYQYLLLDVIAFLFLCVMMFLILSFYLFKLLIFIFQYSNQMKKKRD